MARRNVVPPSRAQLLEQAVRIAVVAGLFYVFDPQEIVFSCAVVVVGNTVSEAVSWLILSLGYRKDLQSLPSDTGRNNHNRSALLATWMPIAGKQCLATALHTVENVMVPAALAAFLASRETATGAIRRIKRDGNACALFPRFLF